MGPWTFKQLSSLIQSDVVQSFSDGNGGNLVWQNFQFEYNEDEEAKLCNVGDNLYWKYKTDAALTFVCTNLAARTVNAGANIVARAVATTTTGSGASSTGTANGS